MDLEKLLESIAEKLRCTKTDAVEVRKTDLYTDEPINKRRNNEQANLPETLLQMKAIAENKEGVMLSRETLFFRQAKAAEFYEDYSFDRVDFRCYYPTYRDMTDRQLRCYFSWRTGIRKGQYVRTSASYVFVYIYELLSLIGCTGAEDGFEKLRQLYKYIEHDSDERDSILFYMRKWMADFVIYYGLSRDCLEGILNTSADQAFFVLMKRKEHDREAVFSALSELASYNVSRSAFYQKYPEDFIRVAVGVYDSMCRYCEKNRKLTYFERLFGREETVPYRIFEKAVFKLDQRKGYEYRENPVCTYMTSKNTGLWYKKGFSLSDGKSRETGKLLKAIDRIMREEYGFEHPLAADDTTKLLCKMIREEIGLLRKEKEKKEPAEIKIDTNLLSAIRKSADVTRDRLIVEEECEEDMKSSAIAEDAKGEGLEEKELDFLRALISGDRYCTDISVSVLCDGINEKLFEHFSDTVIDFDGDVPLIIEDYREELEEMFI